MTYRKTFPAIKEELNIQTENEQPMAEEWIQNNGH